MHHLVAYWRQEELLVLLDPLPDAEVYGGLRMHVRSEVGVEVCGGGHLDRRRILADLLD